MWVVKSRFKKKVYFKYSFNRNYIENAILVCWSIDKEQWKQESIFSIFRCNLLHFLWSDIILMLL